MCRVITIPSTVHTQEQKKSIEVKVYTIISQARTMSFVDYIQYKKYDLVIPEDLPPKDVTIFDVYVAGDAKFRGEWVIMNDTKTVVITRTTCQELLSMIVVAADKGRSCTKQAKFIRETLNAKNVPVFCPTFSNEMVVEIPADAGSAKGFLKTLLTEDNKIHPMLIYELGFGVVAALWYMTSEPQYLPKMIKEFSILLEEPSLTVSYPTDTQYNEFPFTRANLLYNRHITSYYMFNFNFDRYCEWVTCDYGPFYAVAAQLNETVKPLFCAEGIRRLCSFTFANPEYRNALVRGCFEPMQGVPLVEYLIELCYDVQILHAHDFAVNYHTFAHVLPFIQEEKKILITYMEQMNTIQDDFQRKFPAAYGKKLPPPISYHCCWKLYKYRRGQLSDHIITGESLTLFKMADVSIEKGLTYDEIVDLAKRINQNVDVLLTSYNNYAMCNSLKTAEKVT